MANIRKTFNFRNGVQVDEDNFIVNPNGLVGIGTSVPSEFLDVRGTAKVVGLVTASDVFVSGVATITEIKVGTAISISGSGIAASQFYGDGSQLTQLPTSQWLDVDVGLGYTSVYSAGSVGVGTTDPRETFQVGGNPAIAGKKGVGINTIGNIRASGIITATSFVGAIAGPVTGNVAGNVTGNINSSGVSTIATLKATNVNISGLSTHRVAFTNASDNLTDSEDLTFNDTANVLNIVGTTDTDQLNVSGVSTFQNDILFVGAGTSFATWDKSQSRFEFTDHAGLAFGNGVDLTIYHDTFNSYIHETGTGNLNIKTDGGIIHMLAGSSDDLAKFTPNSSVELYFNDVKRFATSGAGATVYNQLDTTNIVASGIITATTELNSPLVGVGTDDPATDIQVRKAGAAQIRVTSDTDAAIVSVGRVSGAGNGANSAFRHGNNNTGFPYSKSNSLDLINYDTGNVNFYLNGANGNAGIGSFHWHKGTSTPLMTLNAAGNLGIGITQPEYKLHVAGVSTFTGNVTCGSNLVVGGNFTLSAGSFTGNVTGNLTGNVSGLLNGTPVGMNTISLLSADDGIGIGVTSGGKRIRINDLAGAQFYVSTSGQVGVCTDYTFTNVKFAVPNNIAIFSTVGVGTIAVRSAADFEFAGGTPNDSNANITKRFMIPPKLGNTGRGNLTGLVAGAMIFNTDTNKLNVYNGTAWREVTDGAV